jgi:hypothetical protein
MSVKFFNFHNDQTYHCFAWVRAGGLGDVKALIARAYERVEKNDWYKMDLDVCMVARDELADLVRDGIEEATILIDDGPGIGDVSDQSAESLTEPLLRDALFSISFKTVAEALLLAEGKWNPDPNLPDIL